MPPFVAMQRLGEKFTMATIEELLDGSLSVRSVRIQRKIGAYFFPEHFV
jgi:hypothetical protein